MNHREYLSIVPGKKREALLIFPIIFFLLLPAFGQTNPYPPSARPDRINLTVTEDPSSSMAATWRTDESVKEGVAEIVLASANPLSIGDAIRVQARTETLQTPDGSYKDLTWEGVTANYHSVVFQDLQPNTLYTYRVGDGANWSEWFQFRTAGQNDGKISFLYFGDAQTGIHSMWSKVIRQAFGHNPHARVMLHAGDLINRANRDLEWGEWFDAGSFIHASIPQMPSPGNHEYETIDGEPNLSYFWQPQFTLPENGPDGLEETVYFSDIQGVRFISLNSYMAEESDEYLEKQKVWLENILKDNPNKWTCIAFHHPIYSPKSTRDNKRMRETFKPLFDKYKVDLVLQGHDHTYARGMEKIPMEEEGTQSGTMYVVSVSGPKMTDNHVEKKFWMDQSAIYTQLYQIVTIEGNKLSFESFTATGELFDSFDLIKRKGKINKIVHKKQ